MAATFFPITIETQALNTALSLPDREIGSGSIEKGGTLSNSTFSYETLSRENWSSAANILFICLIIGFIVSIIITKFLNYNFTFNLCVLIIITSVMMIILGDKFTKNVGVFIISASLITMLLTLFIFFVTDILKGPNGSKDIGIPEL